MHVLLLILFLPEMFPVRKASKGIFSPICWKTCLQLPSFQIVSCAQHNYRAREVRLDHSMPGGGPERQGEGGDGGDAWKRGENSKPVMQRQAGRRAVAGVVTCKAEGETGTQKQHIWSSFLKSLMCSFRVEKVMCPGPLPVNCLIPKKVVFLSRCGRGYSKDRLENGPEIKVAV